ncbi:hypothetical protein H6F75_26330 [Nodosilinea sp. FACHB-131]|uniref:hypothetical protein n=1 Tax=Cyanophyceae TaxID=3028117 RepID=UPI00168347F4|nr:hypothetical protein [Nodosilinea sp. FACHB-131]MBD1877007.1 hypothetical protein [Nodosilinea sp. FACHB-131]
MDLQTSQVDLDSIEIKGDFLEPDAEQVKYLAHAISSVGGLVQVPVVKQLDLETYELVHGYFEYQAYLKARELDPKLPDRIRVFVITKKNEKAIKQQLQVFETLSGAKEQSSSEDAVIPSDLAIKLSNLVSAIEGIQQEVKNTAAESQKAILGAIDERMPKPLPVLEAFNRINEPIIAQQTLEKLSAALNGSKAKQIVANLQNRPGQHPLSSFAEVIEAVGKDIKGRNRLLTELTLLKVIDAWG